MPFTVDTLYPVRYSMFMKQTTTRENEMQEQKTYRTETAAKRAASKPHTPVIVELSDGTFDWFPLGHPLPKGAHKVSFWSINQWRKF